MNIAIPVAASNTQYYLNFAYVKYIKDAGFNPILIAPENNSLEAAEKYDGLLLPGGCDLDPIFYMEDNAASYETDPDRDDFERQLFHAFIDKKKKIFGICRGFQLIAREYIRCFESKNTKQLQYWQHVDEHTINKDHKIDRSRPTHSVRYNPVRLYGSNIEETQTMFVNSMHHQALLTVASQNTKLEQKITIPLTYDKLKVIAWTNLGISSKTRALVVEAIEINIGGGVKAVQWHPEELRDTKLIKTFFESTSGVIEKNQSIIVEEKNNEMGRNS